MKIDPKLDLVLERVVDVPAELVWAAWTKPEHVVKWFTPAPWTTVKCEIDLRVGGAWRFVTRKPDGREIVQFGAFTEVAPPERFAKTERWIDWDVGEVLVTNELVERAGKTTLTSITCYPSSKVRDELVEAGAHRNVHEHYEHLVALLAEMDA